MRTFRFSGLWAGVLILSVVAGLTAQDAEKRPWTLEDAKRIRSVRSTTLSPDGEWVGVLLGVPGNPSSRRGSRGAGGGGGGDLLLYDADTGRTRSTVSGVASFRFTPGGDWLLFTTRTDPTKAKAAKKEGKKGEAEEPKRSARWQRMIERLRRSGGSTTAAPTAGPGARRSRTSFLTLERLDGKGKHIVKGVREFTLDEDGRHLYYVKSATDKVNGIYVQDLKAEDPSRARKIIEDEASFSGLAWQKKLGTLWFFSDRETAAEKKAKAEEAKKAAAKKAEAKKAEAGKKPPAKKPAVRKRGAAGTEKKEKPSPPATQPKQGPAGSGASGKSVPISSERILSDGEDPADEEEEEEEKKVAKKTTAKGKGGEKEKKTGTPTTGTKKAGPEAEAGEGDEPEATPPKPSRLWSYDPKSGKVTPLVGPGINKAFPEKQVLAGGRSMMSRFFGGRTIPARFRSRFTGMGGRMGDGVTLAKDGKRLFVRTMDPPAPRPAAAEGSSPPSGATPRTRQRTRPTGAGASPTTPAPEAEAESSSRTPASADRKPEVVIWHWKDKKVPTEAGRSRGRSRGALWEMDLATGRFRKLSDGTSSSSFSPDQRWMLAHDGEPYGEFTSWDKSYYDVYLTSMKTLKREKILAKHPGRVQWTSDGKFLLWFHDGDWHSMSLADRQRRNLTAKSGMNLGERGHGGGILMPDARHVLLNDEHDVWQVAVDGRCPPVNLTKVGRRDDIQFRPVTFRSGADRTDTELYFEEGQRLYLQAINNRTKAMGYYLLNLLTGRLEKLVEMDRTLGRPSQAKNADRVCFTIQDCDQFPDVWISDRRFRSLRRLTHANPWLDQIDLPRNVLVEWRNLDGKPLQGIVTLPAGYRSGKRYPMIVYIYEKLSSGLHRWRSPSLVYNVPMWAAQGYAVFQPDIIYDIGHPGDSSVKCVLPGVDKVIDMGIADPDRIGLIGHSWGGYETAYIITQTRRFAAAVAGAPVVNMISAYNGIRWSSGKPRQFQYEQTQSRIGGSLWEYPERFVENSPLFHLERVSTPVLILFGDNDGAVPWYQGIEYMLAMRRLGKKAVFLQYKGEDHGLRREWNKKDYDERVMQWFDHHLKDAKPARWIVEPQN